MVELSLTIACNGSLTVIGATANGNALRLVGDRSMILSFKKLWHDKRGNALVIAGAALPLVVGSAGLASDTIQWTLWKRQLQRAADSAAIAGVYDAHEASTRKRRSRPASTRTSTRQLTSWMGLRSGYPEVDLLRPTAAIDDADRVQVDAGDPAALRSARCSCRARRSSGRRDRGHGPDRRRITA